MCSHQIITCDDAQMYQSVSFTKPQMCMLHTTFLKEKNVYVFFCSKDNEFISVNNLICICFFLITSNTGLSKLFFLEWRFICRIVHHFLPYFRIRKMSLWWHIIVTTIRISRVSFLDSVSRYLAVW